MTVFSQPQIQTQDLTKARFPGLGGQLYISQRVETFTVDANLESPGHLVTSHL